ncbi:MAG: DUF817 domain-containing protein [Paracoccaceae bacterium]
MENLSVERQLGDWMRGVLPRAVVEFVMFGMKMAWACLFAGLMLGAIILSAVFWPDGAAVARYDFLVVFAVGVQVVLLVLKMETPAEAKVILLFHITGTAMEVFKLHMGSWSYPEVGVLKVGGVPLFSGFMYASVGSFMARAMRIFDIRFVGYPKYWATVALAVAIYVNFFSHHFMLDLRYALMAMTVGLFWNTRVYFTPFGRRLWMPMVASAVLSSLFLYIAENIGTLSGTWLYSGTVSFSFTSIAKLGSWYLLLFVSFVQVSLVNRRTFDH